MSQMILMLVVGSGMLGRYLVGHMVESVRGAECYLHVIVRDRDGAEEVVRRVLAGGNGTERWLVERDEEVFVGGVVVGRRVFSPRRVFGVLAKAPREVGSRGVLGRVLGAMMGSNKGKHG